MLMQTTLAGQLHRQSMEVVSYISCVFGMWIGMSVGSNTNIFIYIIDKCHNFHMTELGKIGSNLYKA